MSATIWHFLQFLPWFFQPIVIWGHFVGWPQLHPDPGELSNLMSKRIIMERVLLALGMALVAVYIAGRIDATVLSRLGVRSFEQSLSRPSASDTPQQRPVSFPVTFSLWSQPRIAAYKQSLAQHLPSPIAILRLTAIKLEVPVLNGTDQLTLNRGAGWINGTSRPGERGNIGIAGHRDSFFRGLKDLKLGDGIDLVTRSRTETYVVDQMRVVSPDDVSVLQPTSNSSLTLVTCYPFYFVGSAPLRYIVHASSIRSQPLSADAGDTVGPAVRKINRRTK
jgi:sortase A